MNSDKPQAFVKGPRKDGKYAVQYVYPQAGKRLHKIITQQQLDALVAEQRYNVYGAR